MWLVSISLIISIINTDITSAIHNGQCSCSRSQITRAIVSGKEWSHGYPRHTRRTQLFSSLGSEQDAASIMICTVTDGESFNVYKVALSGAIAGGFRALTRTLTYPLDTIKTYQQAGSSNDSEESIFDFLSNSLWKKREVTTTDTDTGIDTDTIADNIHKSNQYCSGNMIETVEEPLTQSGTKQKDYFRGVFISLFSAIPANAVFFLVLLCLGVLLPMQH